MTNKGVIIKRNIKKTIYIPFYAITFIIISLIPRNKKLWIFGRKTGFGEGPEAVMKATNSIYPEIKTIWISQTRKEAEKIKSDHSITTVSKTSLKGFWYTLRAKVIVFTHGLNDVNKSALWGSLTINLWHGSPLKKISLDSNIGHQLGKGNISRLFSKFLKFSYKFVFNRIFKVVIAPSNLVATRYQSAFNINGKRIKVLGDPRCDIIFSNKKISILEKKKEFLLNNYWNLKSDCKVYLYAPTWRDGDNNFTEKYLNNIKRSVDILIKDNSILVCRLHPFTDDSDIKDITGIHFLPSSDFPNINEWLPVFDGLITDYSGIAMDYSLLEKPIVFYAPDLEEYKKKRGLYEDYSQFTSGYWCENWSQVGKQLDLIVKNKDTQSIKAAKNIKKRYQAFFDGKNSERVVREIAKQIQL